MIEQPTPVGLFVWGLPALPLLVLALAVLPTLVLVVVVLGSRGRCCNRRWLEAVPSIVLEDISTLWGSSLRVEHAARGVKADPGKCSANER